MLDLLAHLLWLRDSDMPWGQRHTVLRKRRRARQWLRKHL